MKFVVGTELGNGWVISQVETCGALGFIVLDRPREALYHRWHARFDLQKRAFLDSAALPVDVDVSVADLLDGIRSCP